MTTKERWKWDYSKLRSARRAFADEEWFKRRWGYTPVVPRWAVYVWGTRRMTDEQFQRWQNYYEPPSKRVRFVRWMSS